MCRELRFPIFFALSLVATTRVHAQQGLLGPEFAAFVDTLLASPTGERSAIADSFVSQIDRTPFIESDTVAYFLYKGQALSVQVPGDANGWNPSSYVMERLPDTDLWYYEAVFEPEARLDYKLVLSGTQWILDPRNPKTVAGGFGPNSEIAMPAYVQPEEIEAHPEIAHGSVIEHPNFESKYLGDKRRIKVYLPAGYDDSPDKQYSVLLFHDGNEYLSLGRARNTLDYLIAEERVAPIVGVFVPPNRRNDEYGFSLRGAYERFIVEEVMPFIGANYRVVSDPAGRGTIGASLGGHISAQLCYRHPEQFGLCGLVSPSFQVNNGELRNEVAAGPKKDITFYVDWGTYEQTIQTAATDFVSVLEQNGYEYLTNEWFEGHSWGNWRAHLSNALEYLFPLGGLETGSIHEQIRHRHQIEPNFPNPFDNQTTINFWLDRPGTVRATVYDLVGRLVHVHAADYPAGRIAVRLSGDGLVSGQYLYEIRTESERYQGLMTRAP